MPPLRLLESLEEVIWQACWLPSEKHFDSHGISAYADALRLLSEYGRVIIVGDEGRRVIAVHVSTKEAYGPP